MIGDGGEMQALWPRIREILEYELIQIGDQVVTPTRLAIFLIGVIVVRVAAKSLRRVMFRSLTRIEHDQASAGSAARLAEIVATLVGFLIVLNIVGIPISGFLAVFAALGVGIGLGLQGLVNNIVGGVIILFERPVRPGDVIEVGGLTGTVLDIGLRATRVLLTDGREVVMPNSQLLEQNVVNWTSDAARPLVGLEFGVSYDADPRQVADIALSIAAADERILKDPAPVVRFSGFGDSSLDFKLFVAAKFPLERFAVLSDLRFALLASFREAGIEIPYPQRDLHLRSSSVELR